MIIQLVSLLFLFFGFFVSADEVFDAVEDVASFQLRSDGKYDVICANGNYEIVSKEDILANRVCGGSAPTQFKILSVQKRPDGKFNVLCSDLTSMIATADEIRTGKACSGTLASQLGNPDEPTGKQGFFAGWLAGFKIKVAKKETISHLGVYLSGTIPVRMSLGIYKEKNGLPYERVGFTGEVKGTEGKNEFPLIAPYEAVPGEYWIFWTLLDNAIIGTVSGKGLRKVMQFSGSELPPILDGSALLNAEDAFSWSFFAITRKYETVAP